MIANNNDVLSELRIRHGVADRAESGSTIKTVAVACTISARGSDKSDIDLRIFAGEICRTTTVTAENYRFCKQAATDLLAQSRIHIVTFEACDNAFPNMFKQRRMTCEKSARIDSQVPETQICNHRHHHIQDVITVAQMMMKRNSHTVFKR